MKCFVLCVVLTLCMGCISEKPPKDETAPAVAPVTKSESVVVQTATPSAKTKSVVVKSATESKKHQRK